MPPGYFSGIRYNLMGFTEMFWLMVENRFVDSMENTRMCVSRLVCDVASEVYAHVDGCVVEDDHW